MTIEELMDLQEAGAKARSNGCPLSQNPYEQTVLIQGDQAGTDELIIRHNAWAFGWNVENASLEGSVTKYFAHLITELEDQKRRSRQV